MATSDFKRGIAATVRHRTSFIEHGPQTGPLIILVHGWPCIGVLWRHQIEYLANRGYRCIAPDVRGYGDSSVPMRTIDYCMREVVIDLCELHNELGGAPAVWIGHDWGCPAVWALAAHHRERCAGIANLCVPYFPGGFTLTNIAATVDRSLYARDQYPVGQWDCWLYHRERAGAAEAELSADVGATIASLYRRSTPDAIGKPAALSGVRSRGGFFGPTGHAPYVSVDGTMLSGDDFTAIVSGLERTGFGGANAFYRNDAPNEEFAAQAPDFGRLSLPVLFFHAEWDTVCDTVHTALAQPMREACSNLTEVVVKAGHLLMLERPEVVNEALVHWVGALEGHGTNHRPADERA